MRRWTQRAGTALRNNRRMLLAVPLVLMILSVLYCAVRIREVYRLQTQLTVLRSEVSEMEKSHATYMTNLSYLVEDLQITLYGDVLKHMEQTKETQKPLPRTGQEAWQANRDRSFRNRLDGLERSRLETIERLERIERMIREMRE